MVKNVNKIKKIEIIYQRMRTILKDKKGIKKALAGQYVYGFLVALVDYEVISGDEYREIMDDLVSEFGHFA